MRPWATTEEWRNLAGGLIFDSILPHLFFSATGGRVVWVISVKRSKWYITEGEGPKIRTGEGITVISSKYEHLWRIKNSRVAIPSCWHSASFLHCHHLPTVILFVPLVRSGGCGMKGNMWRTYRDQISKCHCDIHCSFLQTQTSIPSHYQEWGWRDMNWIWRGKNALRRRY